MDAEYYAAVFARAATTGQRDELVKIAADFTKTAINMQEIFAHPATRNALIGAGAGGLLGLLQPRRRGRNALQMALIGGGLGLGYSGLMGDFDKKTKDTGSPAQPTATPAAATTPAPSENKTPPASASAAPSSTAGALNSLALRAGEGAPILATGAGAVGGGLLGRRLTRGTADAAAGRLGRFNSQQLSTFADSGAEGASQIKMLRNKLGPGAHGRSMLQRFGITADPHHERSVNALIADYKKRLNLPPTARLRPEIERQIRDGAHRTSNILARGRLDTVPLPFINRFGRGGEARQLARMAELIDPASRVDARQLTRNVLRTARPGTMRSRTILPLLIQLLGTGAGAVAGGLGGAQANSNALLGQILPAGGAQQQ